MLAPDTTTAQHITEKHPESFGDSSETPTALDAARALIDLGCPVFVARRNRMYDPTLPVSDTNSEYHPPKRWQETPAETSLLDGWRSGDALCLVTGHGLDVVDVDTKNGADPSKVLAAMHALGVEVLATVETPSGGAHYYVRSSGICSANNTRTGVDYRGRGLDGTGAGFLYLPGTFRPKYAERGYRWSHPLQVEDLHDIGEESKAEQTDAVATFLTGLGTKVRTTAQNSGDLTGGEPLDTMPPKLRDLLSDLGPVWTLRNGEKSEDRSERFFHLVAECRRSGLTQGQTVTALDPWCHGVGKYVGRVSVEVSRAWSKVEPLAAVELPDYMQESEELTEPSTWKPLDLGPFLDGTHIPEVSVFLPREDGVCLLYAGRVHSFHGESESGKSLILQAESARLLNLGEHVLWVDFESDAAQVVTMLTTFGASPDAVRERFTYVRPDTGLGSLSAQTALDALLENRYALAVIDGVTEALTLLTPSGGTPEEQVVHYVRKLPRRIAKQTGAAVAQIDHVTKSKDARGRHALGSQHKLNALDGAAYVVEVSQPLGRGMRGEIVLRIAKDRPGHVRPNSGTWRASDRTQEAARVVVDSTSGEGSVFTVQAPRGLSGQGNLPDVFRPTALMQRVSEYLETLPDPVSLRNVRDNVTGKAEYLSTALDRLVMEGYAERLPGERGSTLHKLNRPYRESSDPWGEFPSGAVPVPPIRGGNRGTTSRSIVKPEPGNHSGTTREPLKTPTKPRN